MNALYFVRRSLFGLCLSVIATAVFAQGQTAKEPYQPQVGQEGKDVVWVPMPQVAMEKMLDLAKVTPQDYVIDLGSGDGRTVIAVAKRGARALGIEYNPDLVELSKRAAANERVSDKAAFVKADLFESDFSQATVITLFLLPDINLKLRPTIFNLKPGIRVLSNTFTMEEWKADETVTVSGDCGSYCTVYLWIVPAKVEGTWQLQQGQLTLKQNFQMISGTLQSGGRAAPITNGRLRGDQITFNAGGVQYSGRVSGNTIEGTVKSGARNIRWSATRTGKPAPARS